jgi:hypothetical protein
MTWASAPEPLTEACTGLWVAHGAGTVDRPSSIGGTGWACHPPVSIQRVRCMWLTERDEQEERMRAKRRSAETFGV